MSLAPILKIGLLLGVAGVAANTLGGQPSTPPAERRTTEIATPVAEVPSAQAIAPAKTSKWDVTIGQSKIDDSRSVYLDLASDNEIRGRYNRGGRAHLDIVCRENQTDIYLTFADQFMADTEAWGHVTARIDRMPAKVYRMQRSTDYSALGLWRGSGIGLIKSMIGHDALFVRAIPYNESAEEAEFTITGIGEALRPLRAACKW